MKNSYKLTLIFVLIASFSTGSKSFADGYNSIFTYNGSLLWVVGSNGTILRSGDGGASFQNRSIGTVNYNSVTGKFPLSYWIAGDSGTVLQSSNAGISFTQHNIGTAENLNSVYFYDANTGWLAGSAGNIYKSTNSGLNWIMQVSPVTTSLNKIKFSDANTGVACGNNGVVLLTTNGGNNWNPSATLVNKNLLALDFIGNTIIVSGADEAVMKSTNFGGSWSIIDYKISTKPDIGGLYMTGPSTFYSCGVGGLIRKSTDGGNTFSFQNNPAWADLGQIFFYDTLKGWALSNNANIVLRTSDGGVHWNMPNGTSQSLSWELKVPLQFYTSSGNVFFQSPWNKKEIFVTKANTVYRTLNVGESWSAIGAPLPFGQISNSIYVSSKDTNIFLVAIDSSDDNHARVMRSTDYGQTWSTSFSGFRSSDGTPLAIDPNHPDTIYYGLQSSVLYRSTNFGLTWAPAGSQIFDNVCYIKVLPGNSNTILVGGRDNFPDTLATIFRSTDFGVSWTQVDSNTGDFPELPCIMTSPLTTTIYAAEFEGDNGGVKRSTNLGASWTFINIDEYVWSIDIARDDPNVFVYADWGGGINTGYITYDAGVHFTLLPTVSSTEGNFSVYFYNRNTLFFQQPYGFYKLKVTTSSPIGIQPISTEIPKQFSMSQNYPNPFNPNTKIKFDIPANVKRETSNVRLIIFDILGREVAKLVDQRLQPGSYSVDWDASNYPSGVYFYRIQTDNFTETKKMILLK